MPDSATLSHTKWDCKYHVVFIPQYRRQALYYPSLKTIVHALWDRTENQSVTQWSFDACI